MSLRGWREFYALCGCIHGEHDSSRRCASQRDRGGQALSFVSVMTSASGEGERVRFARALSWIGVMPGGGRISLHLTSKLIVS